MTQARNYLLDLHTHANAGAPLGLTSVCSAHPLVIEAGMIEAQQNGIVACIEATCNQVNQDGGYTGMTPSDFRDFVMAIAQKLKFPTEQILFGGDHLGPNPWRKLPAAEAMAKALIMTKAYAAAGFSKIHLDASMSCADDPVPLPVATIADRAALLAEAAEAGAILGGHPAPAYIIGTEVPVPGGAAEEIETLEITRIEDAAETLELHKNAFIAHGLPDVYGRVVGLVVQPGVEFGNANVIGFKPEAAAPLSRWRHKASAVVFEAHSTDYQTAEALDQLVHNGFCILKVGPGLTFALREALYGLDQIAGVIVAGYVAGSLPKAMEQAMLAAPGDWQGYYHGDASEQFFKRHFSYSDRSRYYWHYPLVSEAVARLFEVLADLVLPEPLISQFLARQYAGIMAGDIQPKARALAIASVQTALAPYTAACQNGAIGSQ